MTNNEVMKELKAAGTAQTRKVYRRHGILGNLFGVSYATLGGLKKRIKVDQSLAEQLWETGNHDARILATMIADPNTISVATLNAWVKDVNNPGLAGACSNIAAEAPSAKGRMERWTVSRHEMIACTGWHTLASLAKADNDLPNSYFVKYIETIEAKIHTSQNWVKYSMNSALIKIGVRNSALEKKALAAAKRIGKVDIDHGATGCKTPDAAAYIKKTVTRQRERRSGRKAS